MDSILYVDDEILNIEVFKATFSDVCNILVAQDTKTACEILQNNTISVVITDQRMPGETGIEFIERVKELYPEIVFMILSGYADFDVTIKAIESGRVYRFLQKPWMEKELIVDIKNALDYYHIQYNNKQLLINLEKQNKKLSELKKNLEDENSYLRSEIKTVKNFENIITQNNDFILLLNRINEIAKTDASVIISGETGTGKELVARAIHNLSSRSNKPFICVNCAAIPESLFESEMFGHEKGAFTGAIAAKKGKFELAHNGTLFLDELGEVSMAMQPKLLRSIQEGYIERVGGSTSIKLNIRIICATNKDLLYEIKKGTFRSDLFYRLNVFPLELPPLRNRSEDIPLLIDFFVQKYSNKYKKKINAIPKKAIIKLKSYSWPGNVRELENIVERAVITSINGKLSFDHIFIDKEDFDENYTDNIEEIERRHITNVLIKTSWKIGGPGGAAERLGMKRTTLQSRIKKLNIKRR